MVTGWLEQRQQAIIDFLITMIQAQRATIRQLNGGGDRRLSDAWRHKLAVKAHAIPSDFLQAVAAFKYSPETFLRWYQRLVAQKYTADKPGRRRGRSRTDPETVTLVVRMAGENPGWGLRRIVGELKKIGIRVSKSTVARILAAYGIEPSPKRRRTWRNFLDQQWHSMAAADLFTVEVLQGWGVKRVRVLLIMRLATRKVHIAGIVAEPYQKWTGQIARNETDEDHGFLREGDYLIHDRATVFGAHFRKTLAAGGVTAVPLPPRSPNLNAYMERVIRTIREECLDHFIIFSERHPEVLLHEYLTHYHNERPHQGLNNELIVKRRQETTGLIQKHSRLGGLLNHYSRRAA